MRRITIAASPPETDRSSGPPPRTATIAGNSAAHTTEATDARWKPRVITTHTAPTMAVTSGNTTASTPAVVATPRPPLNRRVTGNT